MSAHKSIDKLCVIIVALTLVIAIIFCNGQIFGIKIAANAIGYENRIFDSSKVHTLDIVMNDWDGFIENCENEEYSSCNIVIDGEAIKNVGIRAKGNTSLSSVKSMDSSRYSFKIEFDQYDSTKSYHGLDKLCLNNIIQDNTYMKDYLSYTLMKDFGVDAPLCSYVYITVNGEDWGLYLAVEAIEESFLKRNYGSNYGEVYKPDSMSFGGGRGNGMDFDMNDFIDKNSDDNNDQQSFSPPGDFSNSSMPDDFDFSDFDPSKMGGENGGMPDFNGGFGGMGSDDVKLKYIDDDTDSYSNIFNNAKTDVNTADKKRLINSLKILSEQSDIESTVNVEEVIRYFVVHNFLCNGDSYTGQMIHNYYLYEKDGQLSMIPWDYNLAFGTFQGSNASSSVNSPIDTPVSGDMSDRPMISWIFDNKEYTEMYHELFSEFISSNRFSEIITDTANLIDPYVEKDPTKFCTYDEFQKGVTAINDFCRLRSESVKGQLDGTIPSTTDGQSVNSSALIDTSSLTISDMGTMGDGGFGGGPGGNPFDKTGKEKNDDNSSTSIKNTSNMQPPNGEGMPDFGGEPPESFDPSKMIGEEFPEGFDGEAPDEFKANGNTDGNNNTSSSNYQNSNTNETISTDNFPSNRPSMNGFPTMNENAAAKNNNVSYILIGVSVLILFSGIGFALRFKR